METSFREITWFFLLRYIFANRNNNVNENYRKKQIVGYIVYDLVKIFISHKIIIFANFTVFANSKKFLGVFVEIYFLEGCLL